MKKIAVGDDALREHAEDFESSLLVPWWLHYHKRKFVLIATAVIILLGIVLWVWW